jgi:hypothetical protein
MTTTDDKTPCHYFLTGYLGALRAVKGDEWFEILAEATEKDPHYGVTEDSCCDVHYDTAEDGRRFLALVYDGGETLIYEDGTFECGDRIPYLPRGLGDLG